MPGHRNFDDFIKPGFVSVWVGDIRSDDDFDAYLFDHFPAEFGFDVRPQAVHEMCTQSKPVEIGKLVQGFSGSKTFDAKVVEAARMSGITIASSMFIIYHFKFDGGGPAVPGPRMKFIGAVPFPGFE